MKVVFVGPSLPDAVDLSRDRILIMPPALQGDILKAVDRGIVCIGLVDGGFEYQAPVWHKEILHALSLGVRVYGAASMGALRAAECAPFGMQGIGGIYQDYADGSLVDDADVALTHAPQDMGYLPLTIPLVNAIATVQGFEDSDLISAAEANALVTSAQTIFFKDRTWARIVAEAQLAISLVPLLKSRMVDRKRHDALALLDAVLKASEQRDMQSLQWTFNETVFAG